ncbi:hypothetical protein FAES_1962 [Fibrella aestuarina BUZ 2]|uniref:Uncharacterized protein n=1 Tax=Fibrella aestuarina BUZ 2 TaxID=1166018 RepID=I0K768_9BACT|nr:hypothetical protein [Fibrella aestuarina]CCG99971.1 hypothetical protein FAES_1962 [Fibrella aestuarina BUZ 2]
MKINALLLGLGLLVATAAQAQDSMMVKKPQPKPETMPTRRSRGTAKPMPSPKYGTVPDPKRNMDKAPLPPDSSQGTMKRDTVR